MKNDFVIATVIVVVVIAFLLWLWCRGRSDGKPNFISFDIISAEGYKKSEKSRYYVRVMSGDEVVYRTNPAKVDNVIVWRESASWAPQPENLKSLREEVFKFEVFDCVGSRPSKSKDKRISTFKFSLGDLLDAGVDASVSEVLQSRSSDFSLSIMGVARSVYAWRYRAQRFKLSWKNNRRFLSFWTRIFCIPLILWCLGLAVYLILASKLLLPSMVLLFASVSLAILTLPHVFHWFGSIVLGSIQAYHIPYSYGVCFGIVSVSLICYKYGLSNDEGSKEKLIFLITGIVAPCLLGCSFLLADFLAEPGCGWLGFAGKCCGKRKVFHVMDSDED